MTRTAPKGFRPAVETLDRRDLMSVSTQWMSGTTWVARCDDAATSVTVSDTGSSYRITDNGTGASWTKAKGLVAKVELQGGAGADRFVNQAAVASLMFGGGGNDVLVGGSGNDELQGGAGNDRLNGMAGADRLFGQDGDDVLIALDAVNADSVIGGAGTDAVWCDTSDAVSEAEAVKKVGGFANGADRTLTGDNIADPQAGYAYRSFRNDLKTNANPLFATSGPKMDDIKQGALGDCWLLAGLAAIAGDSPAALQQRVVDFDDGTYGVQLGGSYYRVDGDLPASGGTPAYAKLGAQNSMWVAVVEKAYSHYRTGANTYSSIEGGWSIDVNKAFGSTTAGEKGVQTYASSAALANDLYSRWAGGQAVTIGFVDGRYGDTVGTLPIVNNHMYTVAGFTKSANGTITAIKLRNPWGVDGRGNDGSNDGYVTVTPAQLFGVRAYANWGKV